MAMKGVPVVITSVSAVVHWGVPQLIVAADAVLATSPTQTANATNAIRLFAFIVISS
jgi:hypothetical protein